MITIKYSVFYDCKNLKDVRLSNNLTDIAEYTFAHCEKLVVVSKSVKSIDEHGFFGCERLYVYENSEMLSELESDFLNVNYIIINK